VKLVRENGDAQERYNEVYYRDRQWDGHENSSEPYLQKMFFAKFVGGVHTYATGGDELEVFATKQEPVDDPEYDRSEQGGRKVDDQREQIGQYHDAQEFGGVDHDFGEG